MKEGIMLSAISQYFADNTIGAVTLVASLTFIFLGLPNQVYRIWKGRTRPKDVSPLMFSLLAFQSICWVVYGFTGLDGDLAAIIPNSFVVMFALIIVGLYFLLPKAEDK